jgi:transcriptional regulator with XRE-family HTH domain
MKTTDVIRQLCRLNNISVTDLEVEMGFSNGSLTKNNILRSDRLLALAKRFGVSMEYLMGEPDPTYKHITTDLEYAIICEYRQLPIHKQEAILDILHMEMDVVEERKNA